MATIILRHKVADFAKWKSIFDRHEANRREAGITAHTLHRDVNDPSMVEIIFHTHDLSRFREFAGSDDLRRVMKEAGVIGTPEYRETEDVEAVMYGSRPTAGTTELPLQ